MDLSSSETWTLCLCICVCLSECVIFSNFSLDNELGISFLCYPFFAHQRARLRLDDWRDTRTLLADIAACERAAAEVDPSFARADAAAVMARATESSGGVDEHNYVLALIGLKFARLDELVFVLRARIAQLEGNEPDTLKRVQREFGSGACVHVKFEMCVSLVSGFHTHHYPHLPFFPLPFLCSFYFSFSFDYFAVTALHAAYERVRSENAALRAREVRFMHDPLLRRRRLADTPPELVRLLVQGLQVRCVYERCPFWSGRLCHRDL